MRVDVKKALSLMLTLCMVLQCVAFTAFAEVEDGLCEHHPIHEVCGFAEGETDCGFACEICVQELPENTETTVEEETVSVENPEETEPVEEETVPVEDPEATAPVEEEVSDTEVISDETEAVADTVASDSDLVWTLDSAGKLTVTGTGTMNYNVPWKAYNAQITEVVIGEGVTSIASSAFYECFNLTSVSLPSTLKYIYDQAFYRCLKLTSIRIPAGVTSIASNAFAACTAMTGIHVDAGNANYSNDAAGVLYNKNKTELVFCPRGISGSYEIPAGVTTIKSSAFADCTGLETITIANTVVTIESSAFNGCTALKNVHIPASVATIGSSAFNNCDSLTSVVIPGNVVSLGDSCFGYCDNLASVVMEDGLVSIGSHAFSHCVSLTEVKLPETLISISYECFWNCKIETITIPGKVSHIDTWAFETCPLREIRFEGNAPVMESNAFKLKYDVKATAYYPAGDATWTEEVLNGSYGAEITWVPYEKEGGTEEEPVYQLASGACGDNLSWILMSNGALTVSGTGTMNYNVPWKAYASQITTVVIGDGVTSIASSAFYECFNLTSVSLPSTLKYIYDQAFYRCLKLTSIRIPAGVTSIASNAFAACTAMTGIHVDEGNANYSNDAAGVLYNKNKTELVFCPRGISGSYEIPAGVTMIKSSAFADCTGLETITIANTVVTIESSAFNGCTALKNVHIPASVATIGSSAFNNCDSLTSVVIPGNVVSLGDSCFGYCDNLASVVMEDGLVSIGSYAFSHCASLAEVKLPETLISISYECFWNCKIETITIPGKVSHIDTWAFEGCPLREIRFEGNAPVMESNAFKLKYDVKATAYYPAGDATWTEEVLNGSYGAEITWVPYEKEGGTEEEPVYQLASGACGDNLSWTLMSNGALTVSGTGTMNYNVPWKAYGPMLTSVVIEEGITSIASSAFYECFNLTSVSLPSTLKYIYDQAFYRCLKLTSIRIPAGVTSIASNAFAACTAMTGIHVDAGNANYSNDAAGVLYNKNKTELVFCPRGISGSYEIPAGVTMIKSSAFADCTGLETITIANTVVTIESSAFNGCTALKNVHIPASVATIGSSAFNNCDSLTSVVIPGNVVSLGDSCFGYCDNLASVVMEDGLVSIGSYAFSHCASLAEVKLPETLISISYECFWDCKIETITIPGKVSHIDTWAFENCPLREIRFEGNAPVMESNAFKLKYDVKATAYYPAGDATWTEEVLNGSYGAEITWVPYDYNAEDDEQSGVYIIAQGSCGANVSWMIMSDGRLVIYGTGAMQFMMRSGVAPWSAYADKITSVEVVAGVESIADNAFADCSNVTTVSVADTVKSIGSEAFAGCESLETISFDGDAPEIGENCFEDTAFRVEYPENNDTWTEDVQKDFGNEVIWVADSCENQGGHNFTNPVIENRVKATCMENGSYEEVRNCSVCGKESRDTIITDATGHRYADKYDVTCENCGEIRQLEEGLTIPVYRLYNPFTHEHLLTGGVAEKDLLLSVGWSLDGVAWDAPVDGIPVYRLYNPYDDWHTYTISEEEKETMMAAGWTLDGAVSCGAPATGRPIYRLFNPYVKTNFHMFTASVEEKEMLVSAGWILEGIAWYAVG